MIYEFECKDCGKVTEDIFRVAECPRVISCGCGGAATKIISLAAVHGDEVTWLDNNLQMSLRGPEDPPIESRTDYKRFLTKHPEIEPI